MFERLKLKFMIKISKKISRNLKKLLTKFLKKEYTQKGFDLKKDLFYSMMEARMYDLYTSSILLLFYNNPVSLNILMRSQLESLAIIDYFLRNPSKFDNFFKNEFKIEYAKELKKINQDFVEWYGRSSDYVHPKAEGLKIVFGDISQMSPKNPEKLVLKKSYSKEEMEDLFDFIPSLMKESIPHNKIKPEYFEKIALYIINLYALCLEKLEKLHNTLPSSKVENFKEFWKKYNLKKNGKED
jgi:hypothetical protein